MPEHNQLKIAGEKKNHITKLTDFTIYSWSQTSTVLCTQQCQSYESCPCKPSNLPEWLLLTFYSNLPHSLPTTQFWATALSKYFIWKEKHSDSVFCPPKSTILPRNACISPSLYYYNKGRIPSIKRPFHCLCSQTTPQSLCKDCAACSVSFIIHLSLVHSLLSCQQINTCPPSEKPLLRSHTLTGKVDTGILLWKSTDNINSVLKCAWPVAPQFRL